MIATLILLVILILTSYTDLQEGKIYNWATYPGILIAFGLAVGAGLLGIEDKVGPEAYWKWWGVAPFGDCLGGFLMCGGAMVFCYVFFAGQVGGGDIKLIAMMGAFLGIMEGLEAMLWSFIIAGAVALIRLIWRHGLAELLGKTAKYVWTVVRYRTRVPLSDEERKPLQTTLCLSPSALAAVLVVRWDWLTSWFQGQS